ncbi:hypothetical protein N7539_006693 [Penicillium diatomitis]|uniref:Uncharacterized protein n=1 Tax=Penicillium diatomitis TaxID=2819901 RepID=A0A9X0BS66_9EURO|nr:uncharacterized protein N7539_006693 [Penicillium diatomitis]KAJ5480799.1 hypothetical protein N7539_006693 [Penicillium diatomitis]
MLQRRYPNSEKPVDRRLGRYSQTAILSPDQTVSFNPTSICPVCNQAGGLAKCAPRDHQRNLRSKHDMIKISPRFPLKPQPSVRDLEDELSLYNILKRVARAGMDFGALGELLVKLLYRRDEFCHRVVTALVDGGECLETVADAMLQYYDIRDSDGSPLWILPDRY